MTWTVEDGDTGWLYTTAGVFRDVATAIGMIPKPHQDLTNPEMSLAATVLMAGL